MIKKLRYRFILIATAALLIVQGYVMGLTNIITRTFAVTRVNRIMSILIDNSGKIPEMPEEGSVYGEDMRAETPYETRYFSVMIDKEGHARIADVSHIAAVEDNEALNLAAYAHQEKHRKGLFDTGDSVYYYAIVKPGSKQHRTAKNLFIFQRFKGSTLQLCGIEQALFSRGKGNQQHSAPQRLGGCYFDILRHFSHII